MRYVIDKASKDVCPNSNFFLAKGGGGLLRGGARKLAYFLNGIRKNCIYFDGLQKTGISSDTANCILKDGIRHTVV